jgi:glucokinase
MIPAENAAREAASILAIDVGGTSTRVARVDADGRVLQLLKFPTPTGGRLAPLCTAIAEAVRELRQAPQLVTDRIGLALPGRMNPRTRIIERAVNLPALEGVSLADALEDLLRMRIIAAADVSAAAYAQWRCESPPPPRYVYLAIGTGVGGCAVLDGRVSDYASGGPTHLGHLIVDTRADAPTCGCGARGCLEAFFRSASGAQSVESERTVEALAVGLQQISHLLVPDVIALGGGVIEHAPQLVERAAALLAQSPGRLKSQDNSVRRAGLRSDDAGVAGAAMLALSSAGS